jgi:chromosome segregation ATPase
LRQSFESEFLANVSDSVNPVTLTPAKTNQLRANYFAAYQIHTLLLETKSQLTQVLAKYQKLIDELATNRSEFNQITKSDLPASQKTMADAQKLQADMKTEIARLSQLIPSLTAKVQASQTAYDKSRAVLAPLEPEFNRLSSGLRTAQQLLANAESNLASLDRRLQDIASQISRLQNEAAQIQNMLPGQKIELDRAASDLRNAESARSQYNMSWERDRALRANPEYSSLQNERQILDSRLSPEQVRLQQLQSERNRIAKDLEICGSQAGIGTTPPGQVPGLTPPLVPGVIPPQEPQQPTEPAGVDCSALEQAVANADQMIAQQRNVVDQINGRRNEVASRIEMIERNINNEIQRINNQLVQNEETARSNYRRIERNVSQNENRLWSIRNSELPALVNENNQRMNERNTAQTQIAQGRQGVDQFTRDLNKFKLANDWDKKTLDVDSKLNQLSADQKTLSDAQNLKLTSEKKLAQGISTEADMKKRISELNARVVALNQRADQLNVGLKNLPAERAPIDAKISAQQNELDTRKQAFLNGF